ncbi:MAG: rod shape-determining protein [Candidatus Dojkabacteria bacterium]|nr:rod shape-determining protein [Candidatus Dojkabacteria bacterium]
MKVSNVVKKIYKIFKKDRYAIDFGTSDCVIISRNDGIILHEPTVLAIDTYNKKILAVGHDAKVLLGRKSEGLLASRPLKNGGISSLFLAQTLLKEFVSKCIPRLKLSYSEFIISVPLGLPSIQKRALIKALKFVGINNFYMFPKPIAVALASDLPIDQPYGNLIVNLGGGVSEVIIVSMNSVVSHISLQIGGDVLDENIVNFIRKKYFGYISNIVAEKVKISIGSAVLLEEDKTTRITVKDASSGFPKEIVISGNEIIDPIKSSLYEISNGIKKVIADAAPEIVSDLMNRGGILSGGTALLSNIDKFFSKLIGIPFIVVDDPLISAANGTIKVFNKIDEYKHFMNK